MKSKSTYEDLLMDEDLGLQRGNQKIGNNNKNLTSQQKFEDELDDLKRFEELFNKLIKENKLDKNDLLRKLKASSAGTNNNAMLEEGDSSQYNDMLLDE